MSARRVLTCLVVAIAGALGWLGASEPTQAQILGTTTTTDEPTTLPPAPTTTAPRRSSTTTTSTSAPTSTVAPPSSTSSTAARSSTTTSSVVTGPTVTFIPGGPVAPDDPSNGSDRSANLEDVDQGAHISAVFPTLSVIAFVAMLAIMGRRFWTTREAGAPRWLRRRAPRVGP